MSLILITWPLLGYSKTGCDIGATEIGMKTDMIDHSQHQMGNVDTKSFSDDGNCCTDSCECSMGSCSSSVMCDNLPNILNAYQSKTLLNISDERIPSVENTTLFRPPILS